MILRMSFKVQSQMANGFWKDIVSGIKSLDEADKLHHIHEAANPSLDYRIVRVTEELV